MALNLRRSKWLKLDHVEKWTTLRDCQRNGSKLLSFAQTWAKNVSETPELKGEPRFSNSVASSVAVCTASWLRTLQDNHDTYARNHEPYAEMRRRGFRLEAITYPTRHVERLVDPHTSGYISMLNNDEASRFVVNTAAAASVQVSLYPPGFNPSTDTLKDRDVWLGLMKTYASILSAAYIHQRVVDFACDSPLLVEACRLLFPHLMEQKFLYVREPEGMSKSEDEDSSSSTASPSSSSPDPNSGEVTVSTPGRNNHLAISLEATVFHNTWVVLPSVTDGSSSGSDSEEKKEWTVARVKQLGRYMADHDCSIVFVDNQWPMKAELEGAIESARRVNDRLHGTQCAVVGVDDVVQNFPLMLRTHMLSIFIPPSQESAPLRKVLHTGLLSTKVVGLNCNALDAFAMYPHVQFTESIGNAHRYLGGERSFIQRHFNTWGNENGLGSGIPIGERFEVWKANNTPGEIAALEASGRGGGKQSKHLLFQERTVQFWQQPYPVTAIPLVSARYLGL